jgi:hypothetical protein
VLGYGQSWTSPEGVTFTVGSPSGGSVTLSASGAGGAVSGTVAPPPPPTAVTPQASFLNARLASGPGTLQVTEGAAVVVSGTAVRADGTGAGGVPVQVQSSRHGLGVWRTIASSTVTGSGLVTAAFRPVGTSDYRLLIEASATEQGSVSNLLTVVVKPAVIAAVSKPIIVHGRTVGLNVSIPGHAGQLVTVQRWSNNAWRPYATVRLGSNGKRSVAVRLAAKGHYRYRFVKAADAFHLGAFSKTLQVRAL